MTATTRKPATKAAKAAPNRGSKNGVRTARTPAMPPQPKATVETVTPDMAGDWLDRNTHNRPLYQSQVDHLVGVIQRGEWALNGDAIRFATDGTLLDGQHRLWAILESKTACETLVIRGLPTEAQETMDQGRRRNLRDYLALRGEKNSSRLAAVVNYWWRYERGHVRPGGPKPTIHQALATLDEHPTLRDAALGVQGLYSVLGLPVPIGAACYYEFHSINEEQAEDFFARLRSGKDLSEGDPILALRRWLEQHRSEQKSGGRSGGVVIHALTIKAWNLHVRGMTCDRLSWKATGMKAEAFPEPEA